MSRVNSLTTATQLMLVLLTVAGSTLNVLFPVGAEEPAITEPKPLVVPTGTVQNLEGVEEKNISEWLGGVGGGELAGTETETPYKVDKSRDTFNQTELNRRTNGPTSGDNPSSPALFPVTEF